MHDGIIYAVKTKYKEIILYLIFGFGTTIVNWGVYSLSVESKSWKFEVWIQEAIKFVSARLLTGGFEIVSVPFLVYLGMNQQILGVEGMAAKVVVSVAVVLLNYFLSKILIFKKKK